MAQTYDRAGNVTADAEREIRRVKAIMREIDKLEDEFQKVERIREIVRNYRGRVERLDARLDRSGGRRR